MNSVSLGKETRGVVKKTNGLKLKVLDKQIFFFVEYIFLPVQTKQLSSETQTNT